jgi:hypothetical protein
MRPTQPPTDAEYKVICWFFGIGFSVAIIFYWLEVVFTRSPMHGILRKERISIGFSPIKL